MTIKKTLTQISLVTLISVNLSEVTLAGALEDAQQAIEASIAANPNIRAYNGLATIAIMENNLEQAKQYLSKSETLEPDNASTRHLKAKLANLDKQPEKAQQLIKQLLQ